MFIVIVPFLNEADYLPTLLDSVAAQTRRPDRLLLVDDGSWDESRHIAEAFAQENAFATSLARPSRAPEKDRLVTASEWRSFVWALSKVQEPYEVVAKLDADLQLPSNLFEEVERRFREDAGLGMTGPYVSALMPDGQTLRQRCPPDHVEGATKFYRRECYEQIAPVPSVLGWDTIDEITARLRGWRTATFELPGSDPIHLRRMGLHDGLLRGYRRWGECAYAYGAHPLYVALGGVSRLRNRPYVLGALNYLVGWGLAALRRLPRAGPEVRAFGQREQLLRIRGLLVRGVQES